MKAIKFLILAFVLLCAMSCEKEEFMHNERFDEWEEIEVLIGKNYDEVRKMGLIDVGDSFGGDSYFISAAKKICIGGIDYIMEYRFENFGEHILRVIRIQAEINADNAERLFEIFKEYADHGNKVYGDECLIVYESSPNNYPEHLSFWSDTIFEDINSNIYIRSYNDERDFRCYWYNKDDHKNMMIEISDSQVKWW